MKRPFLYAALLLLMQCSRCKTDDPRPKTELEKLPPATQEGRTSFGCLVNGQAWTPGGRPGLSPSYRVSYEPAFAGGALNVVGYRVGQSDPREDQIIGVFADSLVRTGTYALNRPGRRGAGFEDRLACAYYDYQPGTTCRGTLTITRLDLQARVIAGTFEFALARPGCDTVKVTHGRFDYPL